MGNRLILPIPLRGVIKRVFEKRKGFYGEIELHSSPERAQELSKGQSAVNKCIKGFPAHTLTTIRQTGELVNSVMLPDTIFTNSIEAMFERKKFYKVKAVC